MKSFYKHVIIFLIALIWISLAVFPVAGTVYSINGSEIESGSLPEYIMYEPSLVQGDLKPGQVVYFSNSHCGACHMANDYLNSFSLEHPDSELFRYALAEGDTNMTKFEDYKSKFHLNHLSVPSVMIGNLTLEGAQDIRNNLETILNFQKEQLPHGGIISYLLQLLNLKISI